MTVDRRTLESLSLRELTELQDLVGQVMRFERQAAILFTDVVGSTEYVVQHGAVAGRALLQKAHDLLALSLDGTGGRVVDTAGDGAFCTFPDISGAADAAVTLQRLAARHNAGVEAAHRVTFRVGLHEGAVLADDERVTGNPVHYAARVQSCAEPGTIRISDEAQRGLPARHRTRCEALPPVTLKGFPGQAVLFRLDWRDPSRFPLAVLNSATGETLHVPYQDRVSFGRLVEYQGRPANDVVLLHPDPQAGRRVSRWHFELLRGADAWELRVLSRTGVTIDGRTLGEGDGAAVRAGSTVEIGGVMTLTFQSGPRFDEATVMGG